MHTNIHYTPTYYIPQNDDDEDCVCACVVFLLVGWVEG
jgi:hypothetical protein